MPTQTDTTQHMEQLLTKLEDIYNSQAALNQKIAVAQMALYDTPDESLSEALSTAFGNAQRNAELMKDAAHKYEMTLNARKAAENSRD